MDDRVAGAGIGQREAAKADNETSKQDDKKSIGKKVMFLEENLDIPSSVMLFRHLSAPSPFRRMWRDTTCQDGSGGSPIEKLLCDYVGQALSLIIIYTYPQRY